MQQARVVLAGISAVFCVAMVGCTATPDDRDNTTTKKDGGTTTTTDGGSGTDAGTVVLPPDTEDGKVGSACTTEVPNKQGNCGETQICAKNSFFPLATCTKTCTADAECDKNGTIQNKCLQLTQASPDKACLRACDPAVIDSCDRPSHICYAPLGGSNAVCQPRCDKVPDYCPTGLKCNATNGQCEGKGVYSECTQGGDACSPPGACLTPQGASSGLCINICQAGATTLPCAAGFECALAFTANGTASKACVQKCGGPLDDACPATTKCGAVDNSGKKYCSFKPPAGTQAAYTACGSAKRCVETAECLVATDGATDGICFSDCTESASACTTGQTCTALGANKYCLINCTAGGTPCPTGTTCTNNQCYFAQAP